LENKVVSKPEHTISGTRKNAKKGTRLGRVPFLTNIAFPFFISERQVDPGS